MIKLWGRLSSINVQKVVWALEELGLAYERVDAGGAFGITDTPEYRRLNPNGLVPTIEHDGFVLWESNAIVRYLAATFGAGRLCPEDAQIRASADRWMDWQATAFTPAMRDAFWQSIRVAPEQRDSEAITRSAAASEKMAAILDEHLASHAHVTGEAFTMGDIAVGAAVNRWLNLPVARQERPHLQRYYESIRARSPAPKALPLPVT